MRVLHFSVATLLILATNLFSFPVHAQTPASEIGVVVMHGKGGNPNRWVIDLAQALEFEGYQVANLEMPWSKRRDYDVDVKAAENEVTAALDALRAKGVKKVFVAGHSQGGWFALHYGGQQIVDGLIAIAPGGQVDSPPFRRELGGYVGRAKSMMDEGRGNEKATFADYEGSRANNPVTTTAAIYFDWFDPDGAMSASAPRKVKPGVPVLYVAPTRDYPGLKGRRHTDFGGLPENPLTRMYEPESSHLEAPAASGKEIIRWIGEVTR
ncbi:MAG: alpha/beta hydrolase [Gammaproteobacteria bacterium]|nr:alpha/beta hydrolase [Gammaproteobacteria bacterium]